MNASDNIGLTDFLVLVFNFFKRNFLLIAGVTALGFFISLAYSMQKTKYYTSELVGFTDIINQTTLLEILGPLTTLTDEKNYNELSSKLNITVDQASQIRELEFNTSRHTQTSHAPLATDKKLGGLIVVKTTVYDQKILSDLEKGIAFFLDNNKFLNSTKNLEAQKTNTLIIEMSKNIALLDSLRRSQNPDMSASTVSIRGEANPINYNDALSRIENLKIQAQTLKSFTVVSSFYTISKPSNNSLLIITAATVAFFILSLLIVFIKELQQLSSN